MVPYETAVSVAASCGLIEKTEYAYPTRPVGTISVKYNVSDFAHLKAIC